jgi:hypothetical protein
MAEETIDIDLVINTANSAKTIGETRKALKDLRTAALQVEEGSEAFNKITKAAGQLQDKVGDLNQRIKFFASDTKNLDGAIATVQGLAGAFSLAQGAMALVGAENEDLQKTLLKVQGSMAVLNGLQEVSNALNKDSAARIFLTTNATKLWNSQLLLSIRGLKGVQAAIAATGFGAIAVAIGLVVANWDKLNKKFEETGVLGKALITILLPIIPLFQAINKGIELLGFNTKSLNEVLEENISKQELNIKVLDAAGASVKRLVAAEKELLKTKAVKAMLLEDEKEREKQLGEIKAAYLGLLKREREEEKRQSDELEKQRKENWEKEKKRIEEERLKRAEFFSEMFALRQMAIQQMREFLKQQAAEDNSFEEQQQKEADARRQLEILNLTDFEQKKQQALFEFQKSTRDLTIADQNQLALERKKYQDALTQIDREQAAQREQIRQAEFQAAVDLTNSLSMLLNSFGENSAEFVAFQKTLSLIQIGLDTAKALGDLTVRANTAGTQAGIAAGAATGGIGAAPAAAAMSAATYVSGAAQILAAIAKAKAVLTQSNVPQAPRFARGGFVSGAGTGTSDSITAKLSNGESVLNANSTAQFGSLLSAINQAGGGVRFASGGVNNQDIEILKQINDNIANGNKRDGIIRAVVTEKEITDSQSRRKRIETASRF